MIKWCMLSGYFLFKCSLQQKAKVTHSRNQYLVSFYLISRNISEERLMKHVQKALSIKLLFVCLHFVYVILATHPHS